MGTTTSFVFGRQLGTALVGAFLIFGPLACAPDPVNRVDFERMDGSASDARDATPDRSTTPDVTADLVPGTGGGTGGSGEPDAMSGTGGNVATDARDAPVEVPVVDMRPREDLPPVIDMVMDMAPRPDLVPDVVRNRMVTMVVADPTANAAADVRLRTVLETKGFSVRLGDDDATAATNTMGAAMVVIAGTSDSAKVAAKYRDVPLPVLVLETAIFDDMRLTASTENTDWGTAMVSQVTILSNHALAGGLAGTIAIMSMSTRVGWGKTAASALKIASIAGMADQTAMFAYESGAAMVGGNAMGRRVGMFPGDTNATLLTADGIKLVSAALDWLFQ
jgi:hypothetical protein